MAAWKQRASHPALMVVFLAVLPACQRTPPPTTAVAPPVEKVAATGHPAATQATTPAERFATSPNVQAGIAAGEFASFYFVNTRSRPAYCRAMNFEIAPFVAKFSAANAAEWTKAQSLMRRGGVDPEAFWTQAQPTLDRVVLRGLGAAPGMSAPDSCRAMVTAPDVAAASLTYAKVNPVLHRALMEAQ